MDTQQAIEFTQKHIDGMRDFIQTLQGELLTSDKLECYCVRMPGLGLPLIYQLGHYGDVLDAYQTGVLHGTLTSDKMVASKVAHCVKDGKGKLGDVMTYAELLEKTIESQQNSIDMAQNSLDTVMVEA